MAKGSFFGEVFNLAILGGIGYLAWNWWNASQASAAAASSTTSSGAATPPPYVYTAPSVSQQLATAAGSNAFAKNGQMDAYQWAALWAQIGQPAITNINTIFFPNGLPANQTALENTPGYSSQGLPLMTAQVFLQGLQANGIGTGLSGFGQPTLISVPIMLSKHRGAIQVPAGTTPAELQARLRNFGGSRVR